MKAQKDTSVNGGSKTDGVRSGKVKKVKSKLGSNITVNNNKLERKEENNMEETEESPEVMQYLDKLQEMVPIMPKDIRLSNFEVITHAINYIRDLRDTLGLPQCDDEDSCLDDDDLEVPLDEALLSFASDALSVTSAEADNAASTPNNKSDYLNTLSLSVSTSPSSPPSNEENCATQQQSFHQNLNNSITSRRQPFFAISNLNGSPTDPSALSMQESLPLKQISCLL